MQSPPDLKPGTTSPCPGCGRPVALSAQLCTHCGQHIRAGVQLETNLGRPEHTAPPPIPSIAPGPGRFREAPIDEAGRRIRLKGILILVICLSITMGTKALADGGEEAVHYAIRFGITTAAAWGVCLLESMVFLEIGVGVLLAALGIAASIATGDSVQHIMHYTAIPTLAWVLAAFVCIFLLADLLEIEYHDAAFLGLAIYLVKAILTWTLFASMFDPPK